MKRSKLGVLAEGSRTVGKARGPCGLQMDVGIQHSVGNLHFVRVSLEWYKDIRRVAGTQELTIEGMSFTLSGPFLTCGLLWWNTACPVGCSGRLNEIVQGPNSSLLKKCWTRSSAISRLGRFNQKSSTFKTLVFRRRYFDSSLFSDVLNPLFFFKFSDPVTSHNPDLYFLMRDIEIKISVLSTSVGTWAGQILWWMWPHLKLHVSAGNGGDGAVVDNYFWQKGQHPY